MSGWFRSLGADRAAWREHEDRAGELAARVEELLSRAYGDPDTLRVWGERVAQLTPEEVGSALMLLVRLSSRRLSRSTSEMVGYWLREPMNTLLRRRFSVSLADAELAVRTAVDAPDGWTAFTALRIAEAMVRQTGAVEAVATLIRSIDERVKLGSQDRNAMRARLTKELPVAAGESADVSMIAPGDGWAAAVLPRLADHDAATASALLRQLASATGSKPGKGWAAETARLLESEAARAVLRLLLERLADAKPVPSKLFYIDGPVELLLGERNGDVVRAAIWATLALNEPWVVPTLLALTLRVFNRGTDYVDTQKVPNAAIFVLGQLGGADAVSALSILDVRARDNGDRNRIAAAREAAGAAMGLSPGQVLERLVDTGGLDENGTIALADGSVTATATLTADLTLAITWDGQAKPPADAPAAEVNAIKRRVKDLRGLMAQERRRVESLFAEDRGWDVAEWRRYYLEHPITSRVAARLLWCFGEDTHLGGDPQRPADGAVRLWHPVSATTDEVAGWRDRLLEEGLRQPFKQAFREIYLLTDAERETRTYSNRFAAHVLRYGQAYALFKERGWVANYLGPYDGGYEGKARREFRDAGLTVVFEHFPADAEQLRGAPDLCATDRVWFHRSAGRARTPIPLDEVPPLVFSEAMRDVDLFVGVASIALDPNWADRGDDPRYEYWLRVSFGELTARAQVRRDVLARILPKLAVAGQVELGDRFVRVRGKLATYQIHLGSANIMIEPTDRYLCIVPNRGKGAKVLLPFESDEVLSVILSKIMLLAADHKITDPTILSQLHR